MRIIVLLILLCCEFSAVSLAQPIPWRGAPFFVSSQSVTLASVLRDLGANSGVPVVVSPHITESYVESFVIHHPARYWPS